MRRPIIGYGTDDDGASTCLCKQRQVFGRPIAEFPAIQYKIADMATQIHTGLQMLYNACWRLDQGANVALEASMTKLCNAEPLGDCVRGLADPRRH